MGPEDRLFVDPAEVDLPVSLSRAWAYVSEPAYKVRWLDGVTGMTVSGLDRGRTGIGSTQHCAHGKHVLSLKIVDWQPFAYLTHEVPLPLGATNIMTFALTSIEGGTRVGIYVRLALPADNPIKKALAQALTKAIRGKFAKIIARNARSLSRLAQEDIAAGNVSQLEPGRITSEDVAAVAHRVSAMQ